MQKEPSHLPIDNLLPELITRIATEHTLILQADPGAGKTTRVPLALMDLPCIEGKILLLEPRRIAARSAARFMATALGEQVGQRVGYSMRLDRKISAITQVEVITEGLLAKRLLSDPELTGVGLVIFDEFHERSIHTDLGLALCREVAALRDKPLRLLIMSATIDAERLSQQLGGAGVLTSPGRTFPIDIQRSTQAVKRHNLMDELEKQCRSVSGDQGDVLVFLPGRAEINQLQERLESYWRDSTTIQIFPLYSGVDEHRLQPLFSEPKNGEKRYILATSIAQTSITLPGVSCVIDTGLERRPRYDLRLGVSRLETQRISAATATQRAGRAGRVRAGRCLQLWSDEQHQALRDHDNPEITEIDLSGTVLTLLNWGVHQATDLEWVTPPDSKLWQAAVDKLNALNALEWRNQRPQLSATGKKMAQMPTESRVARLLIESQGRGTARLGAQLAALISEPTRFSGADIEARLSLFSGKTGQRLQQLADRFEKLIPNSDRRSADIAELLLPAYADRVAERVDGATGRFRLCSGTAVRLEPSDPLCRADYLICIELGGRVEHSELRLSLGAKCTQKQLKAQLCDLIERETLLRWEGESLRALEVERLGKIELKRTPTDKISAEARAKAWCQRIAREGLNMLPGWGPLSEWVARVRYLQLYQERASEPLGIPLFSDQALLDELESWLAPALTEIGNSSELTKIDLKPLLLTLLPWQVNQWLEQYAPSSYVTPSGRKLTIDYRAEIPRVSVKLQEMFGQQESPKTGFGLPIRVELLSPAGRPLAITTDLRHFWQQIYPEVRKENRGRYSKHPWPEDPMTAIASHLTNAALRRQQQN